MEKKRIFFKAMRPEGGASDVGESVVHYALENGGCLHAALHMVWCGVVWCAWGDSLSMTVWVVAQHAGHTGRARLPGLTTEEEGPLPGAALCDHTRPAGLWQCKGELAALPGLDRPY